MPELPTIEVTLTGTPDELNRLIDLLDRESGFLESQADTDDEVAEAAAYRVFYNQLRSGSPG